MQIPQVQQLDEEGNMPPREEPQEDPPQDQAGESSRPVFTPLDANDPEFVPCWDADSQESASLPPDSDAEPEHLTKVQVRTAEEEAKDNAEAESEPPTLTATQSAPVVAEAEPPTEAPDEDMGEGQPQPASAPDVVEASVRTAEEEAKDNAEAESEPPTLTATQSAPVVAEAEPPTEAPDEDMGEGQPQPASAPDVVEASESRAQSVTEPETPRSEVESEPRKKIRLLAADKPPQTQSAPALTPAEVYKLLKRGTHSAGQLTNVPSIVRTTIWSRPTEAEPLGPQLPCRIAFCTSIMRRGWQLRRILLHNMLCMWPFQNSVSWFIGFLSSSQADVLDAADVACAAAQAPQLDVHVLEPQDGHGLSFWHASVAKNAVHRYALEYQAEHRPNERP